MGGVGRDPAGVEVADDDAGRPPVLHHHVEHLGAVEDLDGAGLDLAGQRRVGAEQQLLAGLAPGVERARHLGATEGAGVEEAAVLPGEGNAEGHALVDDLDRQLGQTEDVGLPGPEVAALHRVVEQAVDGVAVAPVVLGGVDAALGGDGVGPAGAVVEGEGLHLVAQLAEGGGGGGAGQARPDHDDLEAAAVVGRHQLHLELVGLPLLLDGTSVGDSASTVPSSGASYPMGPLSLAWTMTGNEMLPRRMSPAKPTAKAAAEPDQPGVRHAEAGEEAPGAVEDVDRQGEVGDDVGDRHRHPGEALRPCCGTRRPARSRGWPSPR